MLDSKETRAAVVPAIPKAKRDISVDDLADLNMRIVASLLEDSKFTGQVRVNVRESLAIKANEVRRHHKWRVTGAILKSKSHVKMNLFDFPLPANHGLGAEPQSFGDWLIAKCRLNQVKVEVNEHKPNLPVRVHLIDAAVPCQIKRKAPSANFARASTTPSKSDLGTDPKSAGEDVKTGAAVNTSTVVSSCVITPVFTNLTQDAEFNRIFLASLHPVRENQDKPIIYSNGGFLYKRSEKIQVRVGESRYANLVFHKVPNDEATKLAETNFDAFQDLINHCYILVRARVDFNREAYAQQQREANQSGLAKSSAAQSVQTAALYTRAGGLSIRTEGKYYDPVKIEDKVLDASAIDVYLIRATPVDVSAEVAAAHSLEELIQDARSVMVKRAELWQSALARKYNGTVVPAFEFPAEVREAIQTELTRLQSSCCSCFFNRDTKAGYIQKAMERLDTAIKQGVIFNDVQDALKAKVGGERSIYEALNFSRLNPFSDSPCWGRTLALQNVLNVCNGVNGSIALTRTESSRLLRMAPNSDAST